MPLTVGAQTYMATWLHGYESTNMTINSNYYAATTCIRVFFNVQKDFMGSTNLLLLITNTRSMPK